MFVDRVRETSSTTGTGALALAGAYGPTFSTFLNGLGNGNTCPICIVNTATSEWEITDGTLSGGTTLARGANIYASSNAGARVTFSAGVKDVFVDVPASFLNAVTGALVYQGTWNPSTNVPTLTSGVGVKGQYYVCSASGTPTLDSVGACVSGDSVIFNGTTWNHVDGTSGYLLASTAASTYAPLASPTFTGTVTIPAGAAISGYLTSATAASTYAPLASPTLTGTPLTTTAALNTNTTQIASTAFVLGQAATATPLVNNTAAVGTSLTYARADHVHPIDTSRAPLASPSLTGTPTINGSGITLGGSLTLSGAFPTTFTITAATTLTLPTSGTVTALGNTVTGTGSVVLATSPTLVGTPLTAAPANGTNNTQIATTAFALAATNNTASVSVAGGANVTLTAAQYTNKTILLTGAITANIQVIVPVAAANYIVSNRTTGAFTVTVIGATGTGVVVPQNTTQWIVADGTNCVYGNTALFS